MGDQQDIGRPIQILRCDDGSRFILDNDALQRMLLADNVKNLPVVVVSVAGAFRKGKSFLLNFFMQYMRNRTQDDWMADPDVPLRGFPWRGGSEPETMGVLLWDEVFVVTTMEGKSMAVLFLDTQGTFDGRGTVKSWATISAFSVIASSVQIYNISQNIGEDDLQYLQLFTEYGRLALQAEGEKPFQNLLFLVRDWPYAYEKQYGLEGGSALLEERLLVYDGQGTELQLSRRDITSAFSDIRCFLMPHPGKKVASGRNFAGCLSEIEEDFKEQLRELVSAVLEENNLAVKKIKGSAITCQELLASLQRLVEVFNGGALPDPKSITEATAEANNVTAVNRAIEHYRKGMEEVVDGSSSYLDGSSLQAHHVRLRESALEQFFTSPKIGGVPCFPQRQERIISIIDQSFQSFSSRNEGRRIMAERDQIVQEASLEAERIIEEARSAAHKREERIVHGAGSGADKKEEGTPVEARSASQESEKNTPTSEATEKNRSWRTMVNNGCSAVCRYIWGNSAILDREADHTPAETSMDHEARCSQDNVQRPVTIPERHNTEDQLVYASPQITRGHQPTNQTANQQGQHGTY